jgi:hypothetical protein
MRSKFFTCTALAVAGVLAGVPGASAPVAHAADPKAKGKKKQAELGDAISKQLQWEDKVMGPDDKRAELDKIARAQAITKAGAEKAERDKAERERQAAREAAQPRQQARKSDVSLPSVNDEGSGRGDKARAQKNETAEAAPAPPPAKPADDKFIDKLLKDESASNRKKASKGDDRELEALLANTKDKQPASRGHGKKSDMVDNLLESADKAPAMPAPRAKPVVPEWARPELSPTPAPAPMAIRPAQKKDDGVIHVVQGAAGPTLSPPRPAPVAARVMTPAPTPTGRRQAAAKSSGWSDPFVDGGSKKVAARDRDDRDPFTSSMPAAISARKMAPPPPAARREPPRPAASPSGGNWNDPFADGPDRKAARRAPAAAPAPVMTPKSAPRGTGARTRWKDPFSDDTSSSKPAARTTVAMREPARGESPKWEIAGARHAARASATSASTRSRWGAIKKRSR